MQFLAGLLLLTAFVTTQTQAQTLTDVDLKPGYLLVQCKNNETDTIGTLGLVINKVTPSQSEDLISLTINSSLFVCSINLDGSKKLSWKKANPYKGFETQYYSFQTNSVEARQVFIDSKRPYNRVKISILSYSSSNKLQAVEATMHEDKNDSFTGTLTLNQSQILTASDIKDLDAGKPVQKKVELYHSSNFTTVINNQEIQLGDENRSGHNLFLQFKKEGQAIRLVKISN